MFGQIEKDSGLLVSVSLLSAQRKYLLIFSPRKHLQTIGTTEIVLLSYTKREGYMMTRATVNKTKTKKQDISPLVLNN